MLNLAQNLVDLPPVLQVNLVVNLLINVLQIVLANFVTRTVTAHPMNVVLFSTKVL